MKQLTSDQSLRADHLVTSRSLVAGMVHLGHDEQALVRPLIENFYDVGVVVLVTLLLAIEVMLPVINANIVQPSRAVVGVLKALAEGRTGMLTGYRVSGPLGSFASRLDDLGRSVGGSLAERFRVVGHRIRPRRPDHGLPVRLAEELGRSC